MARKLKARRMVVATEHDRVGTLQFSSGVGSGDQPLSGSFFIASGPVDLTGEEQAADRFCL